MMFARAILIERELVFALSGFSTPRVTRAPLLSSCLLAWLLVNNTYLLEPCVLCSKVDSSPVESSPTLKAASVSNPRRMPPEKRSKKENVVKFH